MSTLSTYFRSRVLLAGMVIVVTCLLATIHHKNGECSRRRSTSNVNDDQSKTQSLDQLARFSMPFTTSEMLYVAHGYFATGWSTRVASNDPRYLTYIRTYIARPTNSRPSRAGTHHKPTTFAKLIDARLSGRRNGFFVECGANDGISDSHSLFFENHRNWTGLLVEANPRLYRDLLVLNRKAFVLGGCLSPNTRPISLKFKSAGVHGGLDDYMTDSLSSLITKYSTMESVDSAQCFPLADVLAALRVDHVDYLSLDVQGAEFKILKTIDFRRLRIDILNVEAEDPDPEKQEQIASKIRKLFAKTNLYREIGVFDRDLVFERIDLNQTYTPVRP